MKNDLSQKQEQRLSPQVIQTIEILQMGTQELLDFISEASQSNPVIENDDLIAPKDCGGSLSSRLDWLASRSLGKSGRQSNEDFDSDYLEKGITAGQDNETLFHYAVTQLKDSDTAPDVLQVACVLLESLDKNGWLDDSLEDIAGELGCDPELVSRALAVVQSLEPAGIAARNLSECLMLQLTRMAPKNEVAIRLVEQHLPAVSKNQYGTLSKRLDIPMDEIQTACQLIRSLDPRPGSAFSTNEDPIYIVPDIIVTQNGDSFEIGVNDYYSPTLKISDYYQRLSRESDDDETKQYLCEKFRQAKWILQSIDQRKNTILACASSIVKRQKSFFLNGPGQLSVMSLADVASDMGVHMSTVSRAVKDKYLQCSMGVFPLSYFFVRSAIRRQSDLEATISTDSMKAMIRSLIEKESKLKPLSDQKICDLIKKQGCDISRRTVAKYREELGIGSTVARRL